jgi:glycerophosphoryl diester phosphodiesterase
MKYALVALFACSGVPRHVDYEAHRGGRGLWPENTLTAFEHVLALDVDTLEMDILVTADDVLVVHHDERVNPDLAREDGAWLAAEGPTVRALSFAELQRYDVGRIKPGSTYATRFASQTGADGVRIPRLADVVALAERGSRARIRYNLEIKTTPDRRADTAPPERVAEELVAAVRTWKIAARTTIQSFELTVLTHVRALAPEIARSCLTLAETRDGARLAKAASCTIWSPDYKPLTRAQIAEAHGLGLSVVPWTVNEPADIARLLGWGVDGIITDYPDRLPRR